MEQRFALAAGAFVARRGDHVQTLGEVTREQAQDRRRRSVSPRARRRVRAGGHRYARTRTLPAS